MLSFVIPAYNEERYLPATLASIHEAGRALSIEYEIVVANDASTDATVSVAERAGARVVTAEHRQIAKTRNAGARASRGERLIFVDADTRVDRAVVGAAIAAMDGGAVGGGAGAVFGEGAPRYARRMMWWVLGFMRLFRLAAGCFLFCRRDALEAAGWWDERHFAGEEIVLSRALHRQGRFVILRERVVTSPRKFTSRSFGETLWISVKLLSQGMWGVRRRQSTQFWYDGRR